MEWWEKEGKWFDCFEILGVSEESTPDEIKRAYRIFARKTHPDSKNGNQELFERGTLAFNTLNDESRRAKYTEYTRKLKASQANKNTEPNDEEEQMSFEEIVGEYKRREKQIKISINAMIYEVEKKEEKFSSIYESLCQALKSKSISANDFEIRRQKLRSLELSSINSIKEIEEIIKNDLKNINLEHEQKRLKSLKEKFKQTEDILTSGYHQAIIKLNMPKVRIAKEKFKKFASNAAMATLGLTIAVFFLSLIYIVDKGNEAYVAEVEDESMDEDFTTEQSIDEQIAMSGQTIDQKIEIPEQTIEESRKESIDFDYNPDCTLFQNIPDESEYVKFSNIYTKCGREVVIADDEYGVSYLLDANDHSKVLFGNFISYGGAYHDRNDGRSYFVILGADGYEYELDARDCRTVINVESAYSKEGEPYYLEGYGYVIEAYNCGEKYLIDAETRYPFIRNFDDYEPMYYDEEFGCNVYCFNKYGGESKYYLAADDLRKVLKIENSWDD